MAGQIREVQAPELAELYKLRYQVLVHEPGPHNHEDYARRFGPLGYVPDDDAHQVISFGAFEDGRLVGGISLQKNGTSIVEHRKRWCLDVLETAVGFPLLDPTLIAETGRAVVLSTHRGQGLYRSLLEAAEERFFNELAGQVLISRIVKANTFVQLAKEACGWRCYANLQLSQIWMKKRSSP